MSRDLFFILFRAVIILSFLGSVRFALADISGEWNFSLNVQGQSGSAVATIRQNNEDIEGTYICLLYTSPSPRDQRGSRMPSSA